jgi:hypothetical protein
MGTIKEKIKKVLQEIRLKQLLSLLTYRQLLDLNLEKYIQVFKQISLTETL